MTDLLERARQLASPVSESPLVVSAMREIAHSLSTLDTAVAVHEALDDEPRTGAELTRLTGRPRSAVYRHLTALTEAGIAEKVDGRYRLVRCSVHGEPLQSFGGRHYCVVCLHSPTGGTARDRLTAPSINDHATGRRVLAAVTR